MCIFNNYLLSVSDEPPLQREPSPVASPAPTRRRPRRGVSTQSSGSSKSDKGKEQTLPGAVVEKGSPAEKATPDGSGDAEEGSGDGDGRNTGEYEHGETEPAGKLSFTYIFYKFPCATLYIYIFDKFPCATF